MNGDVAATAATLLRGCKLPPGEARILLAHVLGWPRIQLITREREPLPDSAAATFRALEQRRLAGEPVAYLTGTREFYGLTLAVSPAVLIPRPETELLVELALARCTALTSPRMLDLGTGSGAIALAIATACPQAQITATDRSPDALDVARRNATSLGFDRDAAPRVHFLESDWFSNLPADALFDVIVSNPPYIAQNDPHLTRGDLRFEPVAALTDLDDGLSALRAIVAGAIRHLPPGGWLLCEHGYDQAAAMRGLLGTAGFTEVFSERDLAGIERVSGGCLPQQSF